MQRQIILASRSPRRSRILRGLGLKFRVVPSNIQEETGERFSQGRLGRIALSKVVAVASKFKKGIVIGADTVVVLRGKIYGKPADPQDAKRILKDLSGTTQYVWTAVAIKDIESGRVMLKNVKSKVKMKKLKPAEIRMLAGKNLDKAGAYAVQEDDRFIESIEGSFTNIVGFPVEVLKEMLADFGILQ